MTVARRLPGLFAANAVAAAVSGHRWDIAVGIRR
jgi:hypothetical protein